MGSRTLAFRTGSSLPHEPAWSPYPGLSTQRHRNSLAAGSLNLRRRSKPASKYRHETADSPIARDRKSTRLNSSHDQISYAVFCLKKKNEAKIASLPAAI